MMRRASGSWVMLKSLFFFNDTATTEIYTLSLHDALPISTRRRLRAGGSRCLRSRSSRPRRDRKSTRLNSSHMSISYAVFCLKKKTAFFDYDRDGRLNLFVVNYVQFDRPYLPRVSPFCLWKRFRVFCGPTGVAGVFLFHDPATSDVYSLSLHEALRI